MRVTRLKLVFSVCAILLAAHSANAQQGASKNALPDQIAACTVTTKGEPATTAYTRATACLFDKLFADKAASAHAAQVTYETLRGTSCTLNTAPTGDTYYLTVPVDVPPAPRGNRRPPAFYLTALVRSPQENQPIVMDTTAFMLGFADKNKKTAFKTPDGMTQTVDVSVPLEFYLTRVRGQKGPQRTCD